MTRYRGEIVMKHGTEWTVVSGSTRPEPPASLDTQITKAEIELLANPGEHNMAALKWLLRQSDKEREHARVRAKGRREG